MHQIFKSDENGKLIELEEVTRNCWINIVAPTSEEINKIADNYEIPLEFLEDPLDKDESARIERDDDSDSVLIVCDFPVVDEDDIHYASFETIPMGMIITKDYFITICTIDSSIVQSFIRNRIKGFYTHMKTRFALQILYMISTTFLRHLKRLNRQTDEIEKELHESMKNKQLYDLMGIEKSLVYFVTALKSNKVVLDKMMRQNIVKMYEEDQDLLEDVIIENRQGIEMAEVHSNILSGMMDAYASIISNNMNIVMKFLTSFTIILTIPTMVFSFYGMNVKLPFMNTPMAWMLTLGFAFGIAGALAIVFWRRKFF
ncbi:TPA: magnesium transporter CorA family protein [Listeria monocytogenes]|uniref:magnesium transporter CorA family protein n=1 Tax=Listeria monocytogenes TaxID=1639 RepID=UPI00074D66EF|nr:magnesium transporter CorA family protein [Listeria monocytogenes]EAH1840824.1 magnesium transporter CorA family protein [Listeria monocytogenes]EAV9961874.1 magnesium transporter CorA family protein [Listeria monocytogenes]CUL52202.1 Magnesium transporter CorA family protein [Listeria monocytogenes]HAA8627049.1 magnesium transporter CorA family protein [Listeria monocytogenes]HAA9372117.1 magnesium transporter CorA family protein [Listeria monocytogenes]